MLSYIHLIRRFLLFFIIPLLFTAYFINAPDCSANQFTTDIDNIIKQSMKENRIPGITVAITKEDDIIYLKGFGRANENETLNQDTILYIGSLTKSFTAMAIMQLVEKGKIKLDDPVKNYLPWFKVDKEKVDGTITIRNLLNHKSGLSDLNYIPELSLDSSIEEGVRDLERAKLIYPPGEHFNYFNPNYNTLGLIVEYVSGMSYTEYIQKEILFPLDMKNTLLKKEEVVKSVANGYSAFFGFPLKRKEKFKKYALPSGYIASTVSDMAHYLIAQQNGKYKDTRVLSNNGIKKMHIVDNGDYYAMGWFVGEKDEIKIVEHGGSLFNYSSKAVLIPEKKYGVILLINQNHLIYNLFAYDQLKNNIVSYLLKEEINKSITMSKLFTILLIIAIFLIIKDIYQIYRIKEWRNKIVNKSKSRIISSILKEFLIPVILIAGIPYLMQNILNRGFNINIAYNLAPDIFVWFVTISILYLFKGILKIFVLRSTRYL